MKQTKPENEMNNVLAVAQDTVMMTVRSAVRTEQVVEDYMQGLYKVGYDANVAGLQVVKAYWDSLTEIRRDWVKQGAEFAETAVKTLPTEFALPAFPFRKEATEFGQDMFARTQSAYRAFVAPVKTAE